MASAASNDLAASTIAPVDPAPALSETEPSSSIQASRHTDQQLPSPSPVEMSNLTSPPADQSEPTGPSDHDPQSQLSKESSTHPNAQPTTDLRQPEAAHITPTRPNRSRQMSEAIGPPAEDTATASTYLQQTTNPEAGPAVLITLILLNGARHPYKIDQKYLKKRNICNESETINPYDISVYTMKELIWRDWREEWVPRPTIPGAIRLIFFGKLLDDKQTLSDCRFQENTANAVHMTVRPQEFMDDEENAKTGKLGSGRLGRADDGDGDTGCRCCVVM